MPPHATSPARLRPLLFRAFFLLALLAWPRSASAQVNTEPLRKRIKMKGITAIVEWSLTGRTGNTPGVDFGGGLGGGFATERHLAFVYANADYARFSQVAQVSKAFAHARYNYEFLPFLWGELFAQLQQDEFQLLKLRQLFGVGPRLQAIHEGSFDLFLGTAYMFERDAIDVQVGAPGSRVEVWHRWSSYATAHYDIDNRVSMTTTDYFQPALNDLTNVRILSENALLFKVTGVVSTAVTATLRYDSAPATGVKSLDTEFKNTMTLTF